ncbi:flippase [Methanobrevibacter filiformis]|uniref:Putative cell division protein YtgP n=1 Tax=Methanobrevibacter filiformis TaxID=55758 RepID=A0A166C3I5_9EURY|nr:flippase [Methanobrevibacter filiformis]KZX10997.1 putative cell division protein YtgP [Methanobrevibacter filiformis]
MSKIAKGSFLILIGNFIFRIGGYIYKFLMGALLGPSAFGILTFTLQFQGILQVLAAGGIPPAIAKYISQYNAIGEENLARATIYVSLKIMLLLGIILGFLIIFVIAPFLSLNTGLNETMPGLLYPLQAVGFIVPFSVLVGAFRGAFQGVFKMEYILSTRAIEQVFMIVFAVLLVVLGYSTVGAVFGSVIGFFASAVLSIFIFKKYMGKYISKSDKNHRMSFHEELGLAKKIITFAIPVIVTSLAEMGIFAISTFVISYLLGSVFTGYFGAADPISRFPLIISTSLATTILPAVSAAFSTNNRKLLNSYVSLTYRYSMAIVIPMCIGISMFSYPILKLIFPNFTEAASVLSILVIGMAFYSMFAISSSIIQGVGNPRIPMYILAIGTVATFLLNWFLIPIFGIVGGALANTIVCFLIMVPILKLSFSLTKTKVPYKFFIKLLIATLIMIFLILIIPQTILGLILAIVIIPLIYLLTLIFLNSFDEEDISFFLKFSSKLGPFSVIINNLVKLIRFRR